MCAIQCEISIVKCIFAQKQLDSLSSQCSNLKDEKHQSMRLKIQIIIFWHWDEGLVYQQQKQQLIFSAATQLPPDDPPLGKVLLWHFATRRSSSWQSVAMTFCNKKRMLLWRFATRQPWLATSLSPVLRLPSCRDLLPDQDHILRDLQTPNSNLSIYQNSLARTYIQHV